MVRWARVLMMCLGWHDATATWLTRSIIRVYSLNTYLNGRPFLFDMRKKGFWSQLSVTPMILFSTQTQIQHIRHVFVTTPCYSVFNHCRCVSFRRSTAGIDVDGVGVWWCGFTQPNAGYSVKCDIR